jgi:hypothetical protein
MVQLALVKVLVKKKIPPAPSIFIVKGFAKLLHSFAHVVIVPEIKAPVLKPPTMAIGRLLPAITPDGFQLTKFPFEAPIVMLSANAAVGKARAKSADSIIRLILTPPARRFLPISMPISGGRILRRKRLRTDRRKTVLTLCRGALRFSLPPQNTAQLLAR